MQPTKTFSELINGEKPVLVDFYASWCGPCNTMKPILQDLKSRIKEAASIIKIDVDKNSAVAGAYRVQSIPTLMLFRKGKIQWRQSGVVSAKELEEIIKQHAS